MIAVPGGATRLGNDDHDGFAADGESPAWTVTLSPFLLDATAVTNDQYAEFVDDTGYVSEAEQYGWSFVFDGLVAPTARDAVMEGAVSGAPWWRPVTGADWRHPEGPGSDRAGRGDHPVVHVSWADAQAFAGWAGKRLPTEAEWEHAARGGLTGARYPWGDELTPDGVHRANIWQGDFPRHNSRDDGYLGTAPVRSFAPNGYGLYEMAGNVWEWCADWWTVRRPLEPQQDPTGPPTGTTRVTRGGSYLCHASYCNRYRVAARTSNTPDSSTGHTGFRCARSR